MKTGTFFEVNVADSKGIHIFATDSYIRNYKLQDVVKMIEVLKEKFPKEEGYRISVTSWNCSASPLPNEIKEALGEGQ